MLGVLVSISCHALTCGPGTELRGDRCVAAGDSEGVADSAGADDSDSVPSSPHYELNVPTTTIPGDGASSVLVQAFGTNADGSPALDSVVFAVSRAEAGSFDPPSTELRPEGSTVYFTPCSALTPGCTGSVDLTLALSDEPATPVASVTVEIVVPDTLSDAAPCLAGGNTFFLEGEGVMLDGTVTVTEGDWDVGGDAREARVEVIPADEFQGLWWAALFSSAALGKDLAPGVYEDADQLLTGVQPGHPGMFIRGYGGGWCNEIDGGFEIYEIDRSGGALNLLSVSFEQYCDEETVPLTGCIHYQE
jgi:hypothetical protein